MSLHNKQTEKLEETYAQLSKFEAQSNEYLQGINFNPMIVSNYAMYGKKLQDEISALQSFIKKIENEIKYQQKTVKEAYIKVKSLENLEEKQKEQYLRDLQSEEIKEIDDIVNSRRNIA